MSLTKAGSGENTQVKFQLLNFKPEKKAWLDPLPLVCAFFMNLVPVFSLRLATSLTTTPPGGPPLTLFIVFAVSLSDFSSARQGHTLFCLL